MDKLINKLINLAESSNPFNICKELGIIVLCHNLGSINGYTTTNNRIKIIVLNEKLKAKEKRYTLAHELGHIVLRHRYSKLWLSAKTFYNNNTYENEANTFAIKLLLAPYTEEIKQAEYFSYEDIANKIGVPLQILLYLKNDVLG